MANDKLCLSDNVIGLTGLVDAKGDPVTLATVKASVFENNTILAIGNADTPTHEVQTLTPNVIATGGTFMLGYHGDWTAALPYNESLANIKTALEGLGGIGAGNILVTGKQLSDAAYYNGMVFTFGRNFGEAFRIDFNFTSITGPSQNFSSIAQTVQGVSEGVAINLSLGKVGIPVPNVVDVYSGMFIRIFGTRNYNGQWDVDPLLSTKSRLAITTTYVYEEFDGKDLVYIGCLNGKDITMTYQVVAPVGYWGIIPASLAGLVANNTACVLVTAADGAVTKIFSIKPTVEI